MTFVNSLKLFGSNWVKVLKFFLFYVVIWGLCFALFLPTFFEFQDLIVSLFHPTAINSFTGVFYGSLGGNLHNLFNSVLNVCITAFQTNLGLAIYGLVVMFVFLPFLLNIGKYTLQEMLYYYMNSKSKVGFFSALVKSLKKSLSFAICKTLFNILFLAIVLSALYGLSLVTDANFVTYGLPWVVFVVLVLLYSLNLLCVLGWAPAMIVFDCNVFKAFRKGIKAVKRHFWATVATSALAFALFWAIVLVLGVITLAVLVPIMTAFLCIYNMVVFFTSQGMRFYVNETNILTPKKLEEVDNINKTAYIL